MRDIPRWALVTRNFLRCLKWWKILADFRVASTILHGMPIQRFKRQILVLTAGLPALLQASPSKEDFADHPGFAHAMGVQTRTIDGMAVVFQYGQVRPEFAPNRSDSRTRRSLEKGWQFRFDPHREGEEKGWGKPIEADGGWLDITVPHCWDVMPGGRFHDWSDNSPANPPHYNGAAWYRLTFEHQLIPGKRHRIEFLGVQQRARIYLNGREIALHEGGGQPFSIDVTEHLKAGENLLALKVIRRANHEPMAKGANQEPPEVGQIHGPFPRAPDNWPYAGITREVALITENPVTIRKTLIRTAGGRVEAAVIIANHGENLGKFHVHIASTAFDSPPPAKLLEIPAGAVRVVRFEADLKSSAEAWSPANPVLHPITVQLREGKRKADEWNGHFGKREVAAKDGRILLNEKPIFLKGVAMYEETRERGAALLPEDHKRLFGYCRDAGANFIRLQVIQRSPLVYRAADRLGFMVTGEWGGFWYREAAMEAQTQDPQSIFQSHARCAIWDLMNHPSVVIWCSHNESHQFCPEYGRFVAKATEIVRELDWQNRPVSWAAWHPHMGQPEFQHSDIVGFNQYRGAMDAFEALEPDMQQVTRENPGKPLVIMENGAWARPGNRGGKDERDTEDWQADLLRRQHEVLCRHIPPLAGYTYWILCDYRSRKFYTANPQADGYSAMGLYGPKGEIKLVRNVFRDLKWPAP